MVRQGPRVPEGRGGEGEAEGPGPGQPSPPQAVGGEPERLRSYFQTATELYFHFYLLFLNRLEPR